MHGQSCTRTVRKRDPQHVEPCPIGRLADAILMNMTALLRRFACLESARALLLMLLLSPAQALDITEIRKAEKLTPQRFARFFANFTYQFHDEVQDPEVFLSSESGDCDDFAILAAQLLAEKGYHTRLVAVRMPGNVHVVCYVTEIKGYLDFNNRIYARKTVSCGNSIEEIARHVSKSFGANWTSASEFTFTNGAKHLVSTVAKTDIYKKSAKVAAVIAPQPPPASKNSIPMP
jgi:hypothetical protein